MSELHIDLHSSVPDHPAWGYRSDDDFDEAEMERAIIAARKKAYDQLADLDAA